MVSVAGDIGDVSDSQNDTAQQKIEKNDIACSVMAVNMDERERQRREDEPG